MTNGERRSSEQVLAEARAIADMKSLAAPTVFHLAAMQARIEQLEEALRQIREGRKAVTVALLADRPDGSLSAGGRERAAAIVQETL